MVVQKWDILHYITLLVLQISNRRWLRSVIPKYSKVWIQFTMNNYLHQTCLLVSEYNTLVTQFMIKLFKLKLQEPVGNWKSEIW